MILVFTSLNHGGILQYAYTAAESIEKLGMDVRLAIPDDSIFIETAFSNNKILRYKKDKSILYSAKAKESMRQFIKNTGCDVFYAVDDGIISEMTIASIDFTCKKIITIHDTTAHPQNVNIKSKLVEGLKNKLRNKVFKNVDRINLLSRHSLSLFAEKYKKFHDKSYLLPLGSHMPDADEKQPKEMVEITTDYVLFFGRVDKYKGISNLKDVYVSAKKKGLKIPPLVIAGKWIGQENIDFSGLDNVIIIDRYIDDGEMKWLFKNALTVVLPFIEASQSGVLPIAYQCGVPVVTSNVPGLTQFVENGETGFICESIDDYLNAIVMISQKNSELTRLGRNARNYYETHFDWVNNLKDLFAGL